ncbi:hypothetical protein [Thioclava sp. DLFJ5-1]|uniref:hypothetical protein n=1 Tax=Thioclava sp. DLFJ5-1 TaxID=1915314 RepID=UPI0009973659|nr:hypothetical protein [Thioclava sp. DLFJ5-1]
MVLRNIISAFLMSSLPLGAEGVDPCRMFHEDTRLYYHVIQMQLEKTKVPITLPRNFYRTRAAIQDLSTGPERSGERFWLDLDTWQGLNSRDQVERFRAGNERSIAVVLHDVIELDELLQAYAGNPYFWPPEKRAAIRPLITEAPASFDTRLHEVSIPVKRATLPDALYVERLPDGSIRSVISCNTEVPYPSCEQEFRAEGLDAKVRYRLSQLPHWHEIEEATRTMLRCAVDPKYFPENDKRTK